MHRKATPVPTKRGASPLGLVFRVVIIVLLLACAWFVWVQDPSQHDAHVAARFCDSIRPGMSAVEIMQAASTKGGATFEAPDPDVLVVRFGDGRCTLSLDAGAFSGRASTVAGDQ